MEKYARMILNGITSRRNRACRNCIHIMTGCETICYIYPRRKPQDIQDGIASYCPYNNQTKSSAHEQ